MNILIITLILQTILIATIILYLVLEIAKIQNRQKSAEGTTGLDRTTSILIAIALSLLIGSFFAPRIYTSGILDFSFTEETGRAGDTIGGLMNPFIAMAAVITTGLAFYIQYKANEQGKQQFREQINIQKFESQFYEMLKLHRDNVNEMKITGYDFDEDQNFRKYEKIIDGRKSFVAMQTEFECILSIYVSLSGTLTADGFNLCYWLFFFGIEDFEKRYPTEANFVKLCKRARSQHMAPTDSTNKNDERKKFVVWIRSGQRFRPKNVSLHFNYKPFSGHSSRMGHYFRHLYLTVKSIATSHIVTDYEERMKYLKMLRAQLSNHEQILLFYNWLGDFGHNWENEQNKFFTEYRMIHNLWHPKLFDDQFIRDKVAELREKKVVLRGPDVSMFEIDE